MLSRMLVLDPILSLILHRIDVLLSTKISRAHSNLLSQGFYPF